MKKKINERFLPLKIKIRLQPPEYNTLLIASSFTAGAFAGMLGKSVVAPLERTKISFQGRLLH